MKKIALVMAVAALAAAQEQAQKTPAKGAPKKTTTKAAPAKAKAVARNPGPITIPADAKEIAAGTFRWVDPRGQAWLYRRTPFGIMRGMEPTDIPAGESIPTDWKVTEEGDSLNFERPYPFGPYRWTRKKSELNEKEMAVWKRLQDSNGGSK